MPGTRRPKREERPSRVDSIGLKCWSGQVPPMGGSHSHSEIEFNVVESGSLRYLFGGSQSVVAAGQMAVFWASVPHQVAHAEPGTTMRWLTLPLATFLHWQLPQVLVQAILQGQFVIDAQASRFDRDAAALSDWQDDLRSGSDERRDIALLEIEARLRRLALSVQSSAQGAGAWAHSPRASGVELGKVEQMTRFVAEHHAEPLIIADIAKAVSLHPNYAMQLFRREFGLSLGRYLTEHRIWHARRLLATTDASVLQIALESGFGSPSRFYVAFRQACGMSPAQYRATLREPGAVDQEPAST